ncbi:hypothetical protein B0O80DRAFT_437815 [Mortierella sp. GBAus27b]|nr:hypothetical protein BGX31_009548 [Mortierella sp. GBA43]KAI8361525.1 hypothetical protein B0O80DRAFT_437815 [Mortierella sp. GBAus27b]
MPNQFYKKDIHKSMEALLYGLYVYQYLLDTSTLGLLLKVLVQDQFVSLKSSGPTLRIALYVVFSTNILTALRHLNTPGRYAVIIDFIGNVSTPSRSRLLWLDLIIVMLQIAMTLISFNVLKADDGSRRRRRTTLSADRSAGQSQTADASTTQTSGSSSAVSASTTQLTSSGSRSLFSATDNSGSGNGDPSHAPAESSSVLFNYTHQSNRNIGSSQQVDATADYYVDDEEVRYSLDNQPSDRSQQPPRVAGGQGSSSRQDHASTSDDSEEDDEDNDLLEDDYEGILEQETFVLQVQFKDLVNYLVSGQEALSLSRISNNLRAARATPSAGGADPTRAQDLPV